LVGDNYVLSFQSRAVGLIKQLSDVHEQVEQAYVEKRTFEELRNQETKSIPKRLQVYLNIIHF
jgi:pre-mRNA-splicing factor CDC5/CEF1